MALHRHASQLSSARSIDSIVSYTLDAMEYALGLDYASFCVIENGYATIKEHRGLTVSVSRLALDGSGVIVKAANSRATQRIPDTRKEPTYVDLIGLDWKGKPTMLSELAVPVLSDNRTVAVLNVESKRVNAFSDEDQTLLETLSAHVGSVYKRLNYEEKLRALHKHAQQLSSAQTADEIVKYTLDAMEFTLGFSVAEFSMVEGMNLRIKGTRGMPIPLIEQRLDGRGITVKAMKTKRTLRIPDTRAQQDYVDHEERLGDKADYSTLSDSPYLSL